MQISTLMPGADKAKSWLRDHWKPVAAIVVILLLMLGSYGAGRYVQPAKVVEKEKIVTKVDVQVKEKVVYQDKIVEKKVYVKVADTAKHRETTTVKAPDGTVTTKVVEDSKTDTTTKATDDKSEEKVVYKDRVVEKVVTQVVEKEKLVLRAAPQWRIGVMAGVDVYTALGQHAQPIPQLGPVVLGVNAQRRIAGPFSMGLWLTTSAQVGLEANIEF